MAFVCPIRQVDSPFILTYGNPDEGKPGAQTIHNLELSLDSSPQKLTMLVDPRGKVHATSGILPTKAIDIPPDQYASALQAIEFVFLSTPILTLTQLATDTVIELPLADEPEYVWSWVAPDGKDQWIETDKIGPVNRQAHFTGRQEIREGWLVLRQAPSTSNDR